jgi:hypothetical protein
MSILKCSHQLCQHPFQVNRFGASFAAPGDRGKIICPHCENQMAGDPDDYYISHSLSPKQEPRYIATASLPGNGQSDLSRTQ